MAISRPWFRPRHLRRATLALSVVAAAAVAGCQRIDRSAGAGARAAVQHNPACREVLARYAKSALTADTSRLSFEAGVCFYSEGRHADAAEAFARAATQGTDEIERAYALHNLGNAHARRGALEEALAAYRDRLRVGDREGTRRNYELILAKISTGEGPTTEHTREDDRLFDAARRLRLPTHSSATERRAADADW